MLDVAMLDVVMLDIVMLSVVAPVLQHGVSLRGNLDLKEVGLKEKK